MEKLENTRSRDEISSSGIKEIGQMIEDYLTQRGATLSDYDAIADQQRKIDRIVEQSIF